MMVSYPVMLSSSREIVENALIKSKPPVVRGVMNIKVLPSLSSPYILTHTHTCAERDRERERASERASERERERARASDRERERERESERGGRSERGGEKGGGGGGGGGGWGPAL
jgi:uncharacterized membrane protein YgcG